MTENMWNVVLAIKKLNEEYLFQMKNVVSVGIGKKITDGETTEEIAIIVGVVTKVPLQLLSKRDIIPKDYSFQQKEMDVTVLTDVVEVGRIKKLSLLPQAKQIERVRPLTSGVSIGNVGITAGTLGFVAHKQITDENHFVEETVLVSNAHIFTPDATKEEAITEQILQPAPHDNGKNPEDLVANLIEYSQVKIAFDFSTCRYSNFAIRILTGAAKLLRRQSRFWAIAETGIINTIDAAIARPMVEVFMGIKGIGNPQGTAEVQLGDEVKKSGRTTGLTTGSILQTHVTISIIYGYDGFFPQFAIFENQIMIAGNKFSQGGDSGSTIVKTIDSKQFIAGLLFAGSEDGALTIANDIFDIQSAFNLRIGESLPPQDPEPEPIIEEGKKPNMIKTSLGKLKGLKRFIPKRKPKVVKPDPVEPTPEPLPTEKAVKSYVDAETVDAKTEPKTEEERTD